MVNKKGYIKTLEAVIAIILIIIVSYTLIPRSIEKPPEPPLIIQDAMKFINTKIEADESIRRGIVDPAEGFAMGITDIIESIINETKPRNYDFTCAICSNSNTCIIDTPLKRSVYVSDVFIASSEEKQNPEIIRVWFWEGLTGATPADYKEELLCSDSCFENKNECERKS